MSLSLLFAFVLRGFWLVLVCLVCSCDLGCSFVFEFCCGLLLDCGLFRFAYVVFAVWYRALVVDLMFVFIL